MAEPGYEVVGLDGDARTMTLLQHAAADPDRRPALVAGKLAVSVGSEARLAAQLQASGKDLPLVWNPESLGKGRPRPRAALCSIQRPPSCGSDDLT